MRIKVLGAPRALSDGLSVPAPPHTGSVTGWPARFCLFERAAAASWCSTEPRATGRYLASGSDSIKPESKGVGIASLDLAI